MWFEVVIIFVIKIIEREILVGGSKKIGNYKFLMLLCGLEFIFVMDEFWIIFIFFWFNLSG